METENEPELRFANSLLDDRCFLCGTTDNITEEHVFPTWLQNRYDLFNERLTLQNGTGIPYRQLKIPACDTCNNVHLGKIEKSVSEAAAAGREAVMALPDETIAIWLGKILFGILRKERSLLFDRSTNTGETIISMELARMLMQVHNRLQSARRIVNWTQGPPWSLFRCPVIPFGDNRDFNYLDLTWAFREHRKTGETWITPLLCSAMRLGDVGLILSYVDGGRVREYCPPWLLETMRNELHPAQFDEVTARMFHLRRGLRETGITMTAYDAGTGHPMDIIHMGGGPNQFEEPNPQMLAVMIATHLRPWGLGDLDYFEAPDRVRTFLEHPDGTFIQFTREQVLSEGYGLWVRT